MNGMKISIKIAVTAAALAAAAYAPAQETGRAITLDEAIAGTLTENPAMKAAAYEERAAQQQRRAAIGLRMPQINLTGAYAYLGKDIGFDFNDLKTPVNDLAGKILGSGLIAPELIPSIQGLLNPMMNADWFLTLQDRSLGFVGGEVTLPIWMGGKINAANRAARLNERTAAEQGNQTRNALISELVERYFGLALATQVVAVRQQVADGVRRHLEDARVLEKNGMIARSERLYVEFKMAEAERELANAKLQAETLSSALSNTLGRERATGGPSRRCSSSARSKSRPITRTWPRRATRCSRRCRSNGSWPRRTSARSVRLSCRRWWPWAADRSTITRWPASYPAGPWAWASISSSSTV